jgi:uncharacterized protein
MINRNILDELSKWKIKPKRKPLILRGVRQSGKTTVVVQFSKSFDTYLSLNLEISKERALIESTDDVELLVEQIHFYCKKRISKGSCLLFIDEIQFSPKATALLRYFYEKTPQIHVIAAGSLLENAIQSKQISFPVGRVEYMILRPIHFPEFLDAIGETFDLKTLLDLKADYVHDRMMQHFNRFITVGSMPEVVHHYAVQRDLVALASLYDALLQSYQDDVEKYAETPMKSSIIRHIIRTCWNYAGEQINFERFASSNYRSKEVKEAFQALEKAMLVHLIYPVTSTKLPYLSDYRKRPKLFCLETGITNYVAKIQEEVLLSKNIEDVWRGKIAEQVVFHELQAYNYSLQSSIHFWRRNQQGSEAEVDFVFHYKNQIIPIEVKSGLIGKLKSLHLFMEESENDLAVRVWSKALSLEHAETKSGKQFKLLNVPFYYVCVLPKILENLENKQSIQLNQE